MKGFKIILMGASALVCMTASSAMAASTKTPAVKVTATTHAAAPAATVAATTKATAPAAPTAAAAATAAPAPAATATATTPAAPAESKGFFSSLTGHKTETAPASAPAPTENKPPPPAPAFTGLEYVAQAPVGLEDARRAALKAHPGSVTNSVLGLDKAGKLRYIFTISGSPVYVDAADGKIMSKD